MEENELKYSITHMIIRYGLKVHCPVARSLRALGGNTLNKELIYNSSTNTVKQEELHVGIWRV